MGKVDIWIWRGRERKGGRYEGRKGKGKEREKGDGISGYPDIYNSYLIFSFKNVN